MRLQPTTCLLKSAQLPWWLYSYKINTFVRVHIASMFPSSEQERRLAEEGGNGRAPAAYFMPVKGADAMVAAFRAWLNRFAGGAVDFPPYMDPALPCTPDKAVMLDRWDVGSGRCGMIFPGFKVP